jgi:hypothetical protein
MKKQIRSISDLNDQRINKKAKHSDFPIGSKVKIVAVCRDFHFWYGETGTVIENKGVGSYIGITVKLDKPRVYEAGSWPDDKEQVMETFNFEPEDLRLIKKRKKSFIKKALKWVWGDN